MINQKGAVLILSLVILLLVTLVGSSMVQQNRLQFMMAANSQMQSNEFANAESILTLTERYIRESRYVDQATYECIKTADTPPKFDQLRPQQDIDISTITSAMADKSTIEITKTACMTSNVEIVCEVDADDPTVWTADEMQCNQSDPSQCASEIYSIKIAVSDSTGTNRVIESKYSIRCDL